jgi:hypothetical protein
VQQYLYKLATASRIESIISPIGEKEIPESHLRPLNMLPNDAIPEYAVSSRH